jgi:hypothetical protein
MKMALVALTKSFGWVSIIVTIYHSDGDNMDQTYQHITCTNNIKGGLY